MAPVLAEFADASFRQDPDHRRRITETNGSIGDVARSVAPEGATVRADGPNESDRFVAEPGAVAGRRGRPAPVGGAVVGGADRDGCPGTWTAPANSVRADPGPASTASRCRPAHRRRSAMDCRVQPAGAGAVVGGDPAVRRRMRAGLESGAGVVRAPAVGVEPASVGPGTADTGSVD